VTIRGRGRDLQISFLIEKFYTRTADAQSDRQIIDRSCSVPFLLSQRANMCPPCTKLFSSSGLAEIICISTAECPGAYAMFGDREHIVDNSSQTTYRPTRSFPSSVPAEIKHQIIIFQFPTPPKLITHLSTNPFPVL
jgi:hypothetical protein